MTHSVIHYWCLPQPGWWIIKLLIRPGNSASSLAGDTHLHKSHTAVFHTLAPKHKHSPTHSHMWTVYRLLAHRRKACAKGVTTGCSLEPLKAATQTQCSKFYRLDCSFVSLLRDEGEFCMHNETSMTWQNACHPSPCMPPCSTCLSAWV